jgi:hypothetical protein
VFSRLIMSGNIGSSDHLFRIEKYTSIVLIVVGWELISYYGAMRGKLDNM